MLLIDSSSPEAVIVMPSAVKLPPASTVTFWASIVFEPAVAARSIAPADVNSAAPDSCAVKFCAVSVPVSAFTVAEAAFRVAPESVTSPDCPVTANVVVDEIVALSADTDAAVISTLLPLTFAPFADKAPVADTEASVPAFTVAPSIVIPVADDTAVVVLPSKVAPAAVIEPSVFTDTLPASDVTVALPIVIAPFDDTSALVLPLKVAPAAVIVPSVLFTESAVSDAWNLVLLAVKLPAASTVTVFEPMLLPSSAVDTSIVPPEVREIASVTAVARFFADTLPSE